MLIDTHCHINMMVQKNNNSLLNSTEIALAATIIEQAARADVSPLINVGSNDSDNRNCLILAKQFKTIFATVGIHPNDCTPEWKKDFAAMQQWVKHKQEHKIVGIGECGIDKHYAGYNLVRQYDAFKAQIELALENDLALVIHSRDAYDETLYILEEYKNNLSHAVMHCFSYDLAYAQTVTAWNCMLGIGGTLTYPKNNDLRYAVQETDMKYIVLETDAPFLPPQIIRGKQNHPEHIQTIAHALADLKNISFEAVAQQTTHNSLVLFDLQRYT